MEKWLWKNGWKRGLSGAVSTYFFKGKAVKGGGSEVMIIVTTNGFYLIVPGGKQTNKQIGKGNSWQREGKEG